MKVIRAEAMGLCFGVRDALQRAAMVQQPEIVTIHGELVHNEAVLTQLQGRGFRTTSEDSRRELPVTIDVLITAHGISRRERERLEAAGKRLIDTTCPLVRHVQAAAQRFAADGCHVLVIGRPGHVEVQGIVEDLTSYDVITTVDDVRAWQHARLGLVCQSTTPPHLAEQIGEAVQQQNPQSEVRYQDTICQPTRDRQAAVARLCQQVDAVVVIGGANSHNTRQLVELCRNLGMQVCHVQSADDLSAAFFEKCQTVGLTAGTSTLNETIESVERWLAELPEMV